jgi:hypothetical protein
MMLFLMLTGLGNIGEAQPVWLSVAVGLLTVSLIVVVMLRFRPARDADVLPR